MRNRLFWLAVAATAAMYLVLLAGVLVTTTGSADGCGSSWPLCDGQLLPAFSFHALVEFAHRAITSVAGLLVFALAITMWRRFADTKVARGLALAALFFLLLQAALGAMAVVWPQPQAVLALHFGLSLLSFATVLLMAAIIYQTARPSTMPTAQVAPDLRWWTWFSIAYVYVVVYLGAFVRHTGAGLACPDWPLCDGRLWVPLFGPDGAHFAHRLAAAAALLVIGRLYWLARRTRQTRPDVYWGSLAASALLVLQALSGALQVFVLLSTPSRVLHSAIMMLLFGVLACLCLQVSVARRTEVKTDAA